MTDMGTPNQTGMTLAQRLPNRMGIAYGNICIFCVPGVESMRLGSSAHKELFCRSLLETHRDYDPTTFAWPELDGETLKFLRSIPFWQEALATE
ncbi:MAG: hypothetical protein Q6K90_08550, partial [Gloeomargarita sp. HHBFW_bins_162]